MKKLIYVTLLMATTLSFANTAPTPSDDAYTTDWSTDLVVAAPGLLGNDSDPDGDTLETHLLQGPASGDLSLHRDGSFSYEPDFGVAGDVTFVYKAWDGRTFTTATATITVTSGNQAPIAGDDSYIIDSEGRFNMYAPGVLANDSDPEGDPLTTYLTTTPQEGTLGFHDDGSFWYDPAPGASGEVSFTYKISDGANIDYATVTLIISSPQSTCVYRADKDRYGRYSGGHAFWLPGGLGTDFVFDGDGEFVDNGDGTACLTGTIRRRHKPNRAFEVEVHFSGYTETAPPGSPKRELKGRAYVENGGPIDTDTWFYYTNFMGTLTGIDRFEGAIIDLSRRGPAFQVGDGANGKNINFGGSGWLNWRVLRHGDRIRFKKNRGHGDINIDICN